MSTASEPEPEPARVHPAEPAGFLPWLTLWAALTVLMHSGLWLTGFRDAALATAIDTGAARVETLGVGEMGEELIRKAVRSQRDTLPFWSVLAFLGDFLGEPAALAVRALAVATAFSSVAAVSGRPIGYDEALTDCARVQGVWVLGLAVRSALMVALRETEVSTSAALFLPPGTYPAATALGLEQLDVFAAVGWLAMARGGWKRGQVGVLGALAVCGGLWGFESALRVSVGLVTGAGMRLTIMPG